MMTRVLIIFGAVLVFFWLLRRALGSRGKDAPPAPGGSEPAAGGPPPPVSDLVACAQCGVNLPVAEAIVSEGAAPRYFCCEAHRRLGPR